MNSIILCEGSSDFVLLQYYMRTVYGWTDERTQNIRSDSIKRSRTLKKDENLLTIGGCGGCSKIIPAFEKILQRNSISAVGEAFDKVVIITDRDEVGTEEEFIKKINTSVQKYQLMMKGDIKNNTWLSCEYQNGHGKKQIMELLLLVIPFEDTGAMETFLLNAIANDSAYDAEIIRKGNQFVEEVDKERRYLTKRRYITKSKFDVYFSIRTAAEQFVEKAEYIKACSMGAIFTDSRRISETQRFNIVRVRNPRSNHLQYCRNSGALSFQMDKLQNHHHPDYI